MHQSAQKNKKVIYRASDDLDIVGVGPFALTKLHQCTWDTLFNSILEQEIQAIRLKKKICELDEALTSKPLFSNPLEILPVEQALPSTPRTIKIIEKAL